jgi:hypothetical protein
VEEFSFDGKSHGGMIAEKAGKGQAYRPYSKHDKDFVKYLKPRHKLRKYIIWAV